ncbi:M1 family metallopeptidase [Longimicrobium terrae]|nr:M1 family metallopeptidase [Longimicrobium terrae]MBB4634877.1 hypothetical protein [Longimicrobium terrae]NNC31919.1 M1 family metallopeptidase [Longimicrobium terrae]
MMRTLSRAAVLAAAVAALPLAAQNAPEAGGDTSIFRPLSLAAPNQFRSASGMPGQAYWQQRADYRITAQLDTAAETISGSQTVRYRNNSPDTLRFVWMQVDQNLYAENSVGSFINPADSRWGARSFGGGMNMREVSVSGRPVTPHIDGTMMRLDLPRPLAPGESVEMSMAWSFIIPEYGSDRMARQGDLYQIAQWHPRMAVYDDVSGWNTLPYIGQGEFYREIGDYDVSITVPAGFTVGATGTLQNPGEVLTSAQVSRLARAARDTAQVAIITAEEAGTAAASPRRTGTSTWRFRARNVIDFAWAASPRFRWDSESWNGVQCHSLYQPDATAWTTAADMTCFSIREFSRWYPYPYPQATSVAGPVGGMEYPMFVMVHAGGSEQSVFSTIAHEHGHNWFPMIVQNNERMYAWMDEGFNTFIDTWANDLRYPGMDSKAAYRQQYETFQRAGNDPILMLPPDRIPRTQLGIAAYRKPALALHMLRDEVLGEETFDRAFKEYARRWAFRHPQPTDFFRTMEDVSGRKLDWFWRGWFFTSGTLDQSVDGVTSTAGNGGFTAAVRLGNRGGVVMPVRLRLTLSNGETRDVRIPEQVWFNGPAYTYTVGVPAQVTRAEIDPDNRLPDTNRTNNVWGR